MSGKRHPQYLDRWPRSSKDKTFVCRCNHQHASEAERNTCNRQLNELTRRPHVHNG